MTNSEQAIREFAEKIVPVIINASVLCNTEEIIEAFTGDLTALISEHYYPKEKYDELLQQRDELREALINVMAIIKDCYPLLFDNEKPAVKQAEAAIKNTER